MQRIVGCLLHFGRGRVVIAVVGSETHSATIFDINTHTHTHTTYRKHACMHAYVYYLLIIWTIGTCLMRLSERVQ